MFKWKYRWHTTPQQIHGHKKRCGEIKWLASITLIIRKIDPKKKRIALERRAFCGCWNKSKIRIHRSTAARNVCKHSLYSEIHLDATMQHSTRSTFSCVYLSNTYRVYWLHNWPHFPFSRCVIEVAFWGASFFFLFDFVWLQTTNEHFYLVMLSKETNRLQFISGKYFMKSTTCVFDLFVIRYCFRFI